MTPEMQAIIDLMTGRRFSLEDEKRTQNEIWALLEANPRTWLPKREVRIAGGIIDFVVGTTGIEIKLKGRAGDIRRQVTRYVQEPGLKGLILVTAKPVALGATLCGKPVAVLNLARAWL